MSLLELYHKKYSEPSDINEHLPILLAYAKHCRHITECGVRNITSSYAFAAALTGTPENTYILVDPYKSSQMDSFIALCHKEGVNARFLEESDLTCPREITDLLFIDTWHVYGQLKRELDYWNSYVTKYMILHDTTIDAIHGESIRESRYYNIDEQVKSSGFPREEITKGLQPAIEEFLAKNPQWFVDIRLVNNNGLTVLRRRESRP
jgi:hypothetical protein